MTPPARFAAPVLGTPDPQGLAHFYRRLLGWPLRDDEPGWATLRPLDGGTGLSFQRPPPSPRRRAHSSWAPAPSPTRTSAPTPTRAGHAFCLFVRLTPRS